MDPLFEQLKQAKQAVRFDAQARERVRSVLVRAVEAEAVPASRLFFPLSLFGKHAAAFAAALLVVLVGGGASFAAEGTVPGDVLYPVKVRLNEEVRSVLAFSDENRATWETELVRRRLEEVSRLAALGKLTLEAEIELEERFEDHVDQAEILVDKVESSLGAQAAAEAASRLEVVLKAHRKVLMTIGDGDQQKALARVEEERLEDRVRSRFNGVRDFRKLLEDRAFAPDGDRSYDTALRRLGEAKEKIAASRRILEAHRSLIGDAVAGAIEIRIESAEEFLGRGELEFESGGYPAAVRLSGSAVRLAEEARLLTESSIRIKPGLELKVRHIEDDDDFDEDEFELEALEDEMKSEEEKSKRAVEDDDEDGERGNKSGGETGKGKKMNKKGQ